MELANLCQSASKWFSAFAQSSSTCSVFTGKGVVWFVSWQLWVSFGLCETFGRVTRASAPLFVMSLGIISYYLHVFSHLTYYWNIVQVSHWSTRLLPQKYRVEMQACLRFLRDNITTAKALFFRVNALVETWQLVVCSQRQFPNVAFWPLIINCRVRIGEGRKVHDNEKSWGVPETKNHEYGIIRTQKFHNVNQVPSWKSSLVPTWSFVWFRQSWPKTSLENAAACWVKRLVPKICIITVFCLKGSWNQGISRRPKGPKGHSDCSGAMVAWLVYGASLQVYLAGLWPHTLYLYVKLGGLSHS